MPNTENDTQRNIYELYRLQLCSQINVRGSRKGRVACKKISFKGILQAIRSWSPQFNREKLSRAEINRLFNNLYEAVTNLPLQKRPSVASQGVRSNAQKP